MTDTEPPRSEPVLHHRGTCSRPPLATWPIPGAMKTVCPGCDKYAIVWDAPPEVTSTPPVSAYRCREHPGEPVNWRGKGCTRCPKGKPKTRKAKRSSDNETEY